MTTDTLTKQSVIIGSFAIALSLVSILLEAQELWINIGSDYSEDRRTTYITQNAIYLVLYAVAALFSILLIRGAVKRQHFLMTPWLLTALVGVAFSIYFVVVSLMTLPFGHLDFILLSLTIAGMETVILHPLCSLFREIWHEKWEKRKQCVQDQINYKKKMNSGFVNLSSKEHV